VHSHAKLPIGHVEVIQVWPDIMAVLQVGTLDRVAAGRLDPGQVYEELTPTLIV